MPMNQNIAETLAYVETANTSQTSGLRNCGHRPIVFGYGVSQYANHGRPMWISGKMPAHATAKSVIASAKRLIDVRHGWFRSSRISEISVPACPMPIHQTKLMIAKPQPIGTLTPQTPTPLVRSTVIDHRRSISRANEIPKPTNHPFGVFFARTIELMWSVTEANVVPGSTIAVGSRGSLIPCCP